MKVICSFCDPPRMFDEEAPIEDTTEIEGICPECYKRLCEQEGLPEATIPTRLGKCDILKIHEDGDLTVHCGGKKYIVTTDGSVFRQDDDMLSAPLTITPAEIIESE